MLWAQTMGLLRPHEGLICHVARGLRSEAALSGDEIDALMARSLNERGKPFAAKSVASMLASRGRFTTLARRDSPCCPLGLALRSK